MEFALLGPLEVRRDGGVIPLRQGRPRTLLIALLLRAGRVVPADVLIEEVWGDQQLGDAANALQGQVSYLRRALGLASSPLPVLRTVGAGYVLDVDPDSIDVKRFERLVSSAAERLRDRSRPDPARARRELRAGLDLWRGEPLQDVVYESFAIAEITRLRELRAVATEYEIDARLALGHHTEVVGELRQLIAEQPLRERLRAQLVLALYRSGRQAEALRELAAARAQLVEELGVEPGPELHELHRAVLDHDPVLDWSPPDDAAAGGPGAEAAVGPSPAPPGGDVARARPLPAPTTRLVGREWEISRIGEVLVDNRIVTLTGAGGAGKTRLALAVAAIAGDQRPVWLVELADVADPTVVPFEIARAVGVAAHGDALEALAVGIGAQHGLLVLDTCEHLIDVCAEAAHHLLRACPALRVLATSRRPLAVPGEVVWPVPPLGVPPAGPSAAAVMESEAGRLFAERAQAVRPGFAVDADNAADVAAICRILDGLPLAIELAAARIDVLSPAAIVSRLDDRFGLLHRLGHAAEVRQRSLRATIEWSYDLLDDEQQCFFDRLGVFPGWFTLDAAAAVAAPGLAAPALELVRAVVNHSLAVTDGRDSYVLLDTLRAFASERLGRRGGDGETTRARLAAWQAQLCEQVEADLWGDDRDSALIRLRAEMPNLRAALDWAFGDGGDPTVGVRLACSLVWFWGWIGANDEADRWLKRALAVPGLDDARRARLLDGIAMHAFALGDHHGGQRAAEEAADLWAAVGRPQLSAAALVYRGLGERRRGELAAAAGTHDAAIANARDRHDDWVLAVTLYWRAATAAEQGDDELASTLLDEARALAERAGDRRAEGLILQQLSRVARRRGDAQRALDLAGQALAWHEAIGWSRGIAAGEEALGHALLDCGRPGDALEHQRRGLAQAIAIDRPRAVATALEGLAAALAAVGADSLATEALGAAEAVRSQGAGSPDAIQLRSVADVARSLRARLGEDAYAKAFRQGEVLGPAEIGRRAAGASERPAAPARS